MRHRHDTEAVRRPVWVVATVIVVTVAVLATWAMTRGSGDNAADRHRAAPRAATAVTHKSTAAAYVVPTRQRCAQHVQMGLTMTDLRSSRTQQVRAFTTAVKGAQPESRVFRKQLAAYTWITAAQGRAAAMKSARFQVRGLLTVCKSAGA